MKNVVDNLKIRGSYGLVGSDDLATAGGSYYLYIDKITNNDLSYLKWTSGQNMDYQLGGPQMAYYAMSGLGWEKVKSSISVLILHCSETDIYLRLFLRQAL